MHNNEWSLIFFTLISQLSVGLIMMFGFIHWVYPNYNPGNDWWKSPEIIILFLIGIAAFISLLHLGKPLNAPHSMNNLQGSWISKEIFSLGIFALAVLVLFLSKWVMFTNHQFVGWVYIIASILGVVFIYSMSRIYTIATIPPWNHWYTPLSFFTSVTIFGIISFYLVKQYMDSKALLIGSNQIINGITILIVILIGVSAIIYFNYLSRIEGLSIEMLDYGEGIYFRLFVIRLILIALVLLSLGVIYFKPLWNPGILFIILIFIVLQELIGRFLFYKAFFRIGV